MSYRMPLWQPAVLFAGLLLLYWFTMPPDITFEDTSIFAGACATLGLAHPPGYPLHTLTCAPFAQLAEILPISYAQGSALASALAAAGACLVMLALLNRIVAYRPAALLAAGLLGIAPAFWNQAIIPEVYALNALLAALALLLAHRYADGGGRGLLVGLALVTGLGLSNHWPLYVIFFPAVMLWMAPAWRQLRRDLLSGRVVAGCAAAFAAGLAPYIHLLTVDPTAYRFGSVDGWQGLVSYVRRDVYGLGGEEIAFAQSLQGALQAMVWFVREYAYVFGAFVVLGMFAMMRSRQWWRLAAVLWGMLSCTLLLALVRPYEQSSELSVWIFSVYPLPAYLITTVPLAHGLSWAAARLRAKEGLGLAVAALALVALAAARLPALDRSADDVALRHATLLLDSLPAETLLINRTDDFAFPVRYARHFLHQDSALEMVRELDYFEKLNQDGTLPPEEERRLLQEGRTVAFILAIQLATVGRSFHGTHFMVDETVPPGRTAVRLTPEIRDHFMNLHEFHSRGAGNPFTRLMVEHSLMQFISVLAAAQGDAGAPLDAQDRDLLAALADSPLGRYAAFLALTLDAGRTLDLPQVEAAAQRLEPYLSKLSDERRSEALHIVATARILSGQPESGLPLLEKALEEYPSRDNRRVLVDLLQLLDYFGSYERYAQLRAGYPGLDAGKALDVSDARCAEALGAPCAPGKLK